MEWGMIMAFPTVIGMLVLIFAQPGKSYQTFGSTAINEPEWKVYHSTEEEQEQEYRKAV
jgi:hypothetical protein